MIVYKTARWYACSLVFLGALASNQALQAAEGFGPFLGVAAGTTGLGFQGGLQLSPNFALRVLAGDLSIEETREIDEVIYAVDATVNMPQLLLDYHPFENGFFVSGGITRNASSINGTATLSESTQIGSTTVDPDDVGGLRAVIDYDKVEPYLGIGWRTGMGGRTASALSWQFEFGLSGLSDSSVTLTEEDTSTISQGDLDEEALNIEADLDEALSVYLNLRIGIQYRF